MHVRRHRYGSLLAVLVAVLAPLASPPSPARAAFPRIAAADASATATCGTSGTPTATVYLPNIAKTLGGPFGWDTPFYIQNAGAVQATVEATFYRFSDGVAVACHKTVGLGPGTSVLDDPNADGDLTNDTQYSVVLRGFGSAIVATVDQAQGSGAGTEALAYSGFSAGATTVYLPNVTRRFYGYDVPFIVQNLGGARATVRAHFVRFDGAQQVDVGRVIDPAKSRVVDPDSDDPDVGAPGLTDGTQYAVTLTSDQPIAVVANAHDEAIGPVAFSQNGLTTGARTLYAPYAVKVANGMFSPIVVQNIGTAAVDATLTFVPLGALGASQTFTLRAIPAGGSTAFDPRFAVGTTTPCASATANVCLGPGEYSLRIDATGNVAAVVLPNSATTAAGYLAAPSLQPRSVLPIVMRSYGGPSGWNTFMFVQGTATQITVRYYALGSNALVATQQLVLPQGGIKVDPRTVAGLADNAKYAVTIDGNGGTITAIGHELASTGGDASMIYEAFGTQSLPTVPQPGSVSVTVPSDVVVAGATEQLTATVYDQYGVPLLAPVSWSGASSAGTISITGLFSATTSGGTATVTATSSGLATAATLSVQVPVRTTLAGLAFNAVTTPSLDLYVDTAISIGDVQRAVVSAAADVTQIQRDYARPFPIRPQAYVLANASTFSLAVQGIAGVGAPSPWATGECVCSSEQNWVFINWASASQYAGLSDLRHELTHAMECDAAPGATFPAWFDEGNARAEEFTVPGTSWFAMVERYRAASMANAGSLFTLADLTSRYTWAARSDTLATYEYAVAGQAIGLLRSDIGMPGELAMFSALAGGASFETAYSVAAGRPFSDFANAYAARIKALAPAYPALATAQDAPTGAGITFVVYGLPASSPFTLAITGSNGYHLLGSGARTADAYGVYYSYLAAGWPAGSYTISATWSGGVVSTAVVKTSSVADAASIDGEPVAP